MIFGRSILKIEVNHGDLVMGRKKNSSLDTEGIIKLSKLSSEDVARCYVKSVSAEGIGGIDLDDSWPQLFEAFIYLLYEKYGAKLLRNLYTAKILDSELEISNQKYIINAEQRKVYPRKIPGTEYYMYFNCSAKSIQYKLRRLVTLLGVNPKKVFLDIQPYSYVDQDIHLQQNIKISKRVVRLAETANTQCIHNKVIAVEIFNTKYECNTLKGLIASVLGYVAKLSEDWLSRVQKYNRQNILRVESNKENAILYGEEPVNIPDTDYYVNAKMNSDEVLRYLREICTEFCINMNEVKIYYRDLDIHRLDTHMTYSI